MPCPPARGALLFSGGVASGVTVSYGGYEVVSSGASVNGLTVLGGGANYTFSGGLTSGLIVSLGGYDAVSSAARRGT